MLKRAIWTYLSLLLRPFAKSSTVKDWWEIMQVVLSLLGFGAIGTWGPLLGQVVNASPLQSRTMGIMAFVSILLAVTGIRFAYRVRKLTEPIIEINFDPSRFRSCEMRQMHMAGGVDDVAYIQWRVAVRGPKGVTLRNVQVRLANFCPQGADFLPQALSPMRGPQPTENTVTPTFTLNPGITEFVDVARWWKPYPRNRQFSISYCHSWPNSLQAGDYVFLLEVIADGVPKTEKSFRLYVSDGKGKFQEMC